MSKYETTQILSVMYSVIGHEMKNEGSYLLVLGDITLLMLLLQNNILYIVRWKIFYMVSIRIRWNMKQEQRQI